MSFLKPKWWSLFLTGHTLIYSTVPRWSYRWKTSSFSLVRFIAVANQALYLESVWRQEVKQCPLAFCGSTRRSGRDWTIDASEHLGDWEKCVKHGEMGEDVQRSCFHILFLLHLDSRLHGAFRFKFHWFRAWSSGDLCQVRKRHAWQKSWPCGGLKKVKLASHLHQTAPNSTVDSMQHFIFFGKPSWAELLHLWRPMHGGPARVVCWTLS